MKTTVLEQKVEMSIEEKMQALKAEIQKLKALEKESKAKAKELKEEEAKAKAQAKQDQAKERSKKLAEMMAAKPELRENKTQRIKELLLENKTNLEIHEITQYDKKFILDTVWRIEKQWGIR